MLIRRISKYKYYHFRNINVQKNQKRYIMKIDNKNVDPTLRYRWVVEFVERVKPALNAFVIYMVVNS